MTPAALPGRGIRVRRRGHRRRGQSAVGVPAAWSGMPGGHVGRHGWRPRRRDTVKLVHRAGDDRARRNDRDACRAFRRKMRAQERNEQVRAHGLRFPPGAPAESSEGPRVQPAMTRSAGWLLNEGPVSIHLPELRVSPPARSRSPTLACAGLAAMTCRCACGRLPGTRRCFARGATRTATFGARSITTREVKPPPLRQRGADHTNHDEATHEMLR